ncbi:PREDICTED: D-inositol 3-phosphate glycosyltransferase-like [Acropora digitifera]|uniref:D-inositol 3-phosphate glycosyltransferase-like n=1 Tax=Acropora digitifera TaxID=70779 RepID=UPI00077AAF6C|nr:PREDICTED: D-inositol 3-phosphate glycosyltransferase-like [Acropora digitifera]
MASCSRQPQQHDRTIKVTILASEWGSSKGGLSTISRELAIQLAKFPNVEVTVFLPKCFDGNKAEALGHGISIVEAERLVGYHEEMDWLSFPPENLQIDVVAGHGVKLGRHAQVIRKSHKLLNKLLMIFGRGEDEDFKLKGFDIAARSVTALPDTHLVFVGAPEGKHTDVTKRLLDSGISERRLTVRGFRDREALKREFCEADLMLMPSRTEGFGLTGLEALSAGLPVIVSKNSGFGEALGSVPSGSPFVVDPEDPSAWTEAIKSIWNKDRRTRLDEIKVLREAYGKRYSWSEQCKNLLDKMVSLLVNRQDTFGSGQISAQEGVERRSTSTEDRTASPDKDQDIQGGMKRKRKNCSDQDKAGYSDKDKDIQGGMKRKRKKCSDQDKAGELN